MLKCSERYDRFDMKAQRVPLIARQYELHQEIGEWEEHSVPVGDSEAMADVGSTTGYNQSDYLKALDFADQVTSNIRIYSLAGQGQETGQMPTEAVVLLSCIRICDLRRACVYI